MSVETVLVTGASSGIGLELARCFAADGCRLALVARKGKALAALAAELRKAHKIQAHVLTADLAQPESPTRLLAHLQSAGLKVDVLDQVPAFLTRLFPRAAVRKIAKALNNVRYD